MTVIIPKNTRNSTIRNSNRIASMADVARIAKVTTMTVSRAIRTPAKVSPKTLNRINKAIAESGFVLNYAARSLSTRYNPLIVALFPTVMNSVFSGTIEEMSHRFTKHGYQLLIGETDFDIDTEEKLLAGFIGWRPAGIILTGSKHTEGTKALLTNADVPVIELWSLNKKPFDISVGFSNSLAAYEMTRSLWSWGFRRIAFVYINAPHNDRSADRRSGYRRAVKELGLPNDPELELKVEFGVQSGRQALRQILQKQPKVDAVFCASDTLAVGALMEALRAGYQVPGDIAIAGFGDVELASELVPSLTTVRVPRVEIGTRCAAVLLDRIAQQYPGPATIDCGFSIVRRESA